MTIWNPPEGVLQPMPFERMALVGRTGSGKTFLARYLLSRWAPLIVLDSKRTLGRPEWNLTTVDGDQVAGDPDELDRLLRVAGRLRIPVDGMQDAEDVARAVLQRGNVLVYIDEMYAIVPPGARMSPALQGLYTRGRELRIGVWAATQRPAWAPLVMFSEADWFVVFQLMLEEDRKRVAGFLGPQVLAPVPHRHGFWYYHVSWQAPYYVARLRVRRIAAASVDSEGTGEGVDAL